MSVANQRMQDTIVLAAVILTRVLFIFKTWAMVPRFKNAVVEV